AMEVARQRGAQLPYPGGYDVNGNLTTDPVAIMESRRPLPIGYWKGAGLSLLLDMLAALLGAGLSTAEISTKDTEYDLSQVFIAIDLKRLHNYSTMEETLRRIIDDYCSATATPGERLRYPGQSVVETRKKNMEEGVPVVGDVWERVYGSA